MVKIEPWSEADYLLLEKLLGDPGMMEHLGGPDSHEQILARHKRYVGITTSNSASARVFKIVFGPAAEPVGFVGYWETTWREGLVYEAGWSVLPAWQGRGIAGKATQAVLIEAKLEKRHRFLHAFPAVSNTASNAICKKLGFALIEQCDINYPPGTFRWGNNWRFDLFERP